MIQSLLRWGWHTLVAVLPAPLPKEQHHATRLTDKGMWDDTVSFGNALLEEGVYDNAAGASGSSWIMTSSTMVSQVTWVSRQIPIVYVPGVCMQVITPL